MQLPDAPRFDGRGQVALVTGAARGLGRACAIAVAQAGADVALGYRDARADGGTTEAIRALGRRALPLRWTSRGATKSRLRLPR